MELPLFDLRGHLKAWRKHAGLSQKQLAERLKVSQGTIGNYEGTKTPRDLSIGMAEEIAHALGITLAQFIGQLPAGPREAREPARRYVITTPADVGHDLGASVQAVVDLLNEALAAGVDPKLLTILELIIRRDLAALPPKTGA